MGTLDVGGLKVMVDEDGYLVNPDIWNEAVACALAESAGVEELTKERMAIVKFMRDYYRQFNAFPLMRGVCRNVGQSKDCFSEQFMSPLAAWKIAGLPKPDEHVIAELMGQGGVV